MNLALISEGYYAGSNSITVYADIDNGIEVIVFDDETKVELGRGIIDFGKVAVSLSSTLFAGQRIIAYIGSFGEKTFGAIAVLEAEEQATGWKVPDTVNGVPYADYLAAGGEVLPELYSPETCRNLVIDRNMVTKILTTPITFGLRIKESMGGTVQVTIEGIAGAVGGYLVRFDSDAIGTDLSKTYSANGSYSVKIWGANQTEADAVVRNYTLTMPAAVTVFMPNVVDMWPQMDFGYTSEAGKRVIILHCHCTVPIQFQIDGQFTWEDGIWTTGPEMRSNTKTIAAGEYTIRARNKAVPAEAISRQIKLTGF